MRGRQPRQFVAEDDVVPLFVRIDERVPELRMVRERELQHREVRHAARSGADVDDVICFAGDVGPERVRPGEAGDDEAHPAQRALYEQRRQQRREPRRSRDVPLFLHRDREVALVRCGAHRIGARRLAPPFEVLEERGEALERVELVRIDRQEVAGEIFEPIVPREQDEGGGIRRLDDDVGDHHLHLLDAPRGRLHQALRRLATCRRRSGAPRSARRSGTPGTSSSSDRAAPRRGSAGRSGCSPAAR